MHSIDRSHEYDASMTIDELESFVCIASGSGFTHASRVLLRSQPAISRRILQLQSGLDAVLFERVGRRTVLTEAGRALLPHAEAALAAVRDAERAVRAAAGQDAAAQPLRLAMVGTLADSHVVAALRAFQSRFRDVDVELRTATSREVSALVRRGEADLGLRYFVDADPKLESIPLGAEELCVVVPAAHRLRSRRVHHLRAFAEDKWLAFPPDPRHPESSGQQLAGRLLAAGITQPRLAPVDSLTAQKRLVEAGFGIALLPRSSFREELRRGTLRTIAVDDLDADQPVTAVRRRTGHRGPASTAFLQLLQRFTPDLRPRRGPTSSRHAG
jgi:DNA-binding transcriptional LysR family regulator